MQYINYRTVLFYFLWHLNGLSEHLIWLQLINIFLTVNIKKGVWFWEKKFFRFHTHHKCSNLTFPYFNSFSFSLYGGSGFGIKCHWDCLGLFALPRKNNSDLEKYLSISLNNIQSPILSLMCCQNQQICWRKKILTLKSWT